MRCPNMDKLFDEARHICEMVWDGCDVWDIENCLRVLVQDTYDEAVKNDRKREAARE